MIRFIHDYVKKNYVMGKYSRNYYHASGLGERESIDDFELGRKQAKEDYHAGKYHCRHFYLIKILNFIFENKASEILKFIKGYEFEINKNNQK